MIRPTAFISYSRRDAGWKDRLVAHLHAADLGEVLEIWDDSRISVGDDWLPHIEAATERATVAVLLISVNFLTSPFIRAKEIPRLLERRQKNGLRLIPLIVQPCAWKAVEWLAEIQCRPARGAALSKKKKADAEGELAEVALEIWRLVKAYPSLSLTGLDLVSPRSEGGLETDRVMRTATHAGASEKVHGITRPRVLVLDDKRQWLETIDELLGNDFDLTLTTNVEEARRRAKRERFALVVLDMRLTGGISGLDVLSHMRRASPDLRAIILTGYPDSDSVAESDRRGALDFVSKGVVASLRERVKRILRENPSPTRVFLSYDRRDRARVADLYDKLANRGLLPWMDIKSIATRVKWAPQVRDAIDRCDYFLFCVSKNFAHGQPAARDDFKQALERQEGLLDDSIFIINVRLDDVTLMEPFSRFTKVDIFRRDGVRDLLQILSS